MLYYSQRLEKVIYSLPAVFCARKRRGLLLATVARALEDGDGDFCLRAGDEEPFGVDEQDIAGRHDGGDVDAEGAQFEPRAR